MISGPQLGPELGPVLGVENHVKSTLFFPPDDREYKVDLTTNYCELKYQTEVTYLIRGVVGSCQ